MTLSPAVKDQMRRMAADALGSGMVATGGVLNLDSGNVPDWLTPSLRAAIPEPELSEFAGFREWLYLLLSRPMGRRGADYPCMIWLMTPDQACLVELGQTKPDVWMVSGCYSSQWKDSSKSSFIAVQVNARWFLTGIPSAVFRQMDTEGLDAVMPFLRRRVGMFAVHGSYEIIKRVLLSAASPHHFREFVID